jgi:glycosyltransferase involved in cell wall biosynthesis
MLITLLCSDMSSNALVRTYLLAEILARDFDVEILGSVLHGEIWRPALTGKFRFQAVRGARWPLYARSVRALLRQIKGDVIYAPKPLMTSFGVALLARRRTGRPVVLDVDDDELSFRPRSANPLRAAASLLNPNGRLSTRFFISRAGSADAVTVATTGLQAQFGGTLIPHAKDTEVLRPHSEWRLAAKEKLGVAGERVVVFMGTPRPHKGIEDVAEAVGIMRNKAVFAVIGADSNDPYTLKLREQYRSTVFHPQYSLEEVPFLLEAADAVVVPQRLQPQSINQLPSKLLDAMALAKPVVATAVSDMPAILSSERGIVVPPGDVRAMAAALDSIFDGPEEARRMGERARVWCEENASYNAMRPRLKAIIEGVVQGRNRLRARVSNTEKP